MSNIFYTRDDNSTRHYVIPNRMSHSMETVCGRQAFKPEGLALPVNCDECRTQVVETKHEQCQACKEFVSEGQKMHHSKYCVGE